jgi:hypothetical protein
MFTQNGPRAHTPLYTCTQRTHTHGNIHAARAPSGGIVTDGKGSDVDWASNQNEQPCSWQGFQDDWGIAFFEIALKSRDRSAKRCGSRLLQDSRDMATPVVRGGNETTTLFRAVNLQHGGEYFCQVTACSVSGLCTVVESDGFTLDLGLPAIGCVREKLCYMENCDPSKPFFLSTSSDEEVQLLFVSALEAADRPEVEHVCPAVADDDSLNGSSFNMSLLTAMEPSLGNNASLPGSTVSEGALRFSQLSPVSSFDYAFGKLDNESLDLSYTFQPMATNIRSWTSPCCQAPQTQTVAPDVRLQAPNRMPAASKLCNFGTDMVAALTDDSVAFVRLTSAQIVSTRDFFNTTVLSCTGSNGYLSVLTDEFAHVFAISQQAAVQELTPLNLSSTPGACAAVTDKGELLTYSAESAELSRYVLNMSGGWNRVEQATYAAPVGECRLRTAGNFVAIFGAGTRNVHVLLLSGGRIAASLRVNASGDCFDCFAMFSMPQSSVVMGIPDPFSSGGKGNVTFYSLRPAVNKQTGNLSITMAEICTVKGQEAGEALGLTGVSLSYDGQSSRTMAALGGARAVSLIDLNAQCARRMSMYVEQDDFKRTAVASFSNVVASLSSNGSIVAATFCGESSRKMLRPGDTLYTCDACGPGFKALPGVTGKCENCTQVVCEPRGKISHVKGLKPGPALESNTVYTSTVRAQTASGQTAQATSHAIIFDITPPVAGRVNDVVVFDSCNQCSVKWDEDVTYLATTGTLAAGWTNFYDPESDISTVKVGVGTQPQQADVTGWVQPRDNSTHTFTGVNVRVRQWLYVTVQVCNNAHPPLCTIASSNGVMVDDTPPTMVYVYDGLQPGFDIDEQTFGDSIFGSWLGQDEQLLPQLPEYKLEYEWAFTNIDSAFNDSTVAEALTYESSGYSEYLGKVGIENGINEGKIARVCARCINPAGLRSKAQCSDGVKKGEMASTLSQEEPTSLAFSLDSMSENPENKTAKEGEGVLFASLSLPPGAAEEGAAITVGKVCATVFCLQASVTFAH